MMVHRVNFWDTFYIDELIECHWPSLVSQMTWNFTYLNRQRGLDLIDENDNLNIQKLLGVGDEWNWSKHL